MAASFPTSVKSWTALVDRTDYPQAAHVNELYDEVTAIETGYLTGTARLNSSASTVATLSVTGGSTFTGTMLVTGASTFTAAVNVYGLAQFSSGLKILGGGNISSGSVTLSTTYGLSVAGITGSTADFSVFSPAGGGPFLQVGSGYTQFASTKINLSAVGTSTSASSGGGTLPGSPVGFFDLYIAGTKRKVPFYA